MDHAAFIEAVRRDGAGFRTAVTHASLTASVASCPGWTLADLVHHTTEAHYFWASVITMSATSPNDVPRLPRPSDDDLLDALDTHCAALLVAVESTPADTEVWTWAADHSVAFVVRRLAHETAIHRWDAESTAGTVHDLDAALSSDGIDEFLEHFMPDVRQDAEPVGGSVHIHCGDVSGEWTIRPDRDGYDVTREHAKGDCALRGPAGNLFLALWRRVGADAVDVVGDAGVATRFLAATNLD